MATNEDSSKTTPAEYRGGALWAFKRIKEDALPALMDDLLERQNAGLHPDQCDKVQMALGKMVHTTTSIPDGTFISSPIWKVMQDFEKTYYSWNEKKESSDEAAMHRRRKLEKLRSLRHKIAKKTRKHGHVIGKNLDLRSVEQVYDAFGNAVRSAPEIFKELAKAVARFSKRK